MIVIVQMINVCSAFVVSSGLVVPDPIQDDRRTEVNVRRGMVDGEMSVSGRVE